MFACIDIQMYGLENSLIKEIAVESPLESFHYFIEFFSPFTDNCRYHEKMRKLEQKHNQKIEEISGIPADYPGERNHRLRSDLRELCKTHHIVFVYGYNKARLLNHYFRENGFRHIPIVNLEHIIPNPLRSTAYCQDRCPLNNATHLRRCASRKAINLYQNVQEYAPIVEKEFFKRYRKV